LQALGQAGTWYNQAAGTAGTYYNQGAGQLGTYTTQQLVGLVGGVFAPQH